MIDKYRLWELYTLAQQTAQLEKGNFLEVGVWRGGSAMIIAKAFQKTNQSNHLYLADTFTGVAKATEADTHYKGGEHANTSDELVERLLKEQNVTNYTLLKGLFPDETMERLPQDLKLRMVHIDVDVYLSAKESFYYAWPRMVKGGVVAFDDYGFMGCDGVTKLIEELRGEMKDATIIHNINGHAILIKR